MFQILAALFILGTPATNTLCPVMGDPVNAQSQTVEVKGIQYRVCCPTCIRKLTATPEKYLNADGTPKNAPKK
jgi:YHS domain-containing protein